MRIARPVPCLFAALIVVCTASTAGAASKRLKRAELTDLFATLSKAAGAAKTFTGSMKRSDKSIFVMDDEPLVSEGQLWIERPSRFRQDINKPRASVTVVSENELWVYFPAAAEAQYVDVRKGLKGRSDTTSESIMPWLTFDLAGLEKKYRIKAKRTAVPSNAAYRKYPANAQGRLQIEKLPVQKPKECFKIEFVPKEAKFAPGMASLVLWVDGVNPWPLRIERESVDGDLQTTEFSNIVLEAPVDGRKFQYRPPKGTKINRLSD